MKKLALLLGLSLAANAALVATLVMRSARPDAPGSRPPVSSSPANAQPASADTLRAALASGDAAALQAAGLPPEIARELALGRALSRFRAASAATRTAGDARWWRSDSNDTNTTFTREQRERLSHTRRELSDALIAAFGDDEIFSGQHDTRLAYLPAAKRESLRRIEQDYDEMFAEYNGAHGVQLPSDREKLRLLQAERDRDIAALLSPGELADYEMRTSTTSAMLRARFGSAIETEDDFRKLYALQKAFDDQFPHDGLRGRVSAETMRERAEAERRLQADMRAALGDEKYAALRHASDPDLRTVEALAGRLNLASGTIETVATARSNYAAESQRINRDTSLTPQERRAQLQQLGQRAKAEIARELGTEGADAYAQQSPWLNFLQTGMAFSTSDTEAPMGGIGFGAMAGVFPVPPAGLRGPGATAGEVVTFSTSTVSVAGATADRAFIAPVPMSPGALPPSGATFMIREISPATTTVIGGAIDSSGSAPAMNPSDTTPKK